MGDVLAMTRCAGTVCVLLCWTATAMAETPPAPTEGAPAPSAPSPAAPAGATPPAAPTPQTEGEILSVTVKPSEAESGAPTAGSREPVAAADGARAAEPAASPDATAAPPAALAPTAGAEAATRPAVVVAPAPLPASRRGPALPTRDGRYLRIGSGTSVVAAVGSGPLGDASAQALGSVQTVAIGGGVVPGLALAFVLHSATARAHLHGGPFRDATITAGTEERIASRKALIAATELGLLADWYPDPTQGWHVGLSAGLGLRSVITEADDTTMFGVGVGGSALGGYDWSVGPRWSLGVGLTAGGVTRSPLMSAPDGDETDYDLGSWWIGLEGSVVRF
jgi:hypothetical protein